VSLNALPCALSESLTCSPSEFLASFSCLGFDPKGQKARHRSSESTRVTPILSRCHSSSFCGSWHKLVVRLELGRIKLGMKSLYNTQDLYNISELLCCLLLSKEPNFIYYLFKQTTSRTSTTVKLVSNKLGYGRDETHSK
jgi:hypothetical protein